MSKSRDVDEWIRRASGNLKLAKIEKSEGIYYEDLCFNCQQSAEKAIKGLMIHLGLTTDRTHSFRELFKELIKRTQLPDWTEDVLELGDYAVITRYPDDFVEVGEKEYLRAVEIAERVYSWVKNQIR